MKIYNYMEHVVERLLSDILKEYVGLCTCHQCINDIKAIALNNLPPKYVSTEKGSTLSKANLFTIQSEIDVAKVLIEAIERVHKSPRHKFTE